MQQDLRFDGQAVIVTGAGHGLGRAYALELAARGARVVVNDLGTAMDGSGASSSPAADVAREISDNGGTAVPNADDVASPDGAARIVRTALAEFGCLHAVVNNAGTLRDQSFTDLTVQDFDAVLAVHLRGAFLVSREAWPHLRELGHGRIVMISSAAGLFGGLGQANYTSAKMGVVGLVKALALEGAECGLKVNAIAPLARTRMTAAGLPPGYSSRLSAELVAPVVAYLAHPSCPSTGQVYTVAGGRVARVYLAEGPGWVKKGPLSAEDVRDAWQQINAEQPHTVPVSAAQTYIQALRMVTEVITSR
jgi:NAD(P)-dependent dehydrogenase (short-subunit alcohol dehydrogenase family)